MHSRFRKVHPGLSTNEDPIKLFKMSTGTSSPSKNSGRALLRWSEPGSPSREAVVQVVERHVSEAVIRCGLQLTKKTKVYLMGEKFTTMGTIRSCRHKGPQFLLTIRTSGTDFTSSTASLLDPGILAVEDFLTEEQEEQILAGLTAEA